MQQVLHGVVCAWHSCRQSQPEDILVGIHLNWLLSIQRQDEVVLVQGSPGMLCCKKLVLVFLGTQCLKL